MQDYNKKQSQQYEKKPKFDASKLNKSNYVEWAEKIIKNHQQEMKKMEKSPVTTNQVRNLLELLNILRERLRIERVTTRPIQNKANGFRADGFLLLLEFVPDETGIYVPVDLSQRIE